MEWLGGSATSSGCPTARKKRSALHRRPHPNPKPITDFKNGTLQSSSTDYSTRGNPLGSDENYQGKLQEPLLESDSLGNGRKLKKVKLKLGGITRTLHTKSSHIASGSGPVNVRSPDIVIGLVAPQKLEFSEYGVTDAKESSSAAVNVNFRYESVHKSKRVPKIRTVDERFSEDDEEIRYLKKLRASKAASGSAGLVKDGKKKLRMQGGDGHEMELTSDDELNIKNRRSTEDLLDPLAGSSQEMTMTTRKRALECPQSGGLVEFPNGLPAAPSKKQKLSEVEQQLRKAEAAQRRRSQAEKAAKEAEAEAIRKILGQDSSRKKKEEKLKKQKEEVAQEKIDKATVLGPNTVRWIMGPQGTVVTFSDDVGLPKFFEPRPYRYPPPREKCVGPNCTNEYKYRDSKSKLPLCSLHCYKAVQGNVELMPAC